jgi:hypothetical protein
MHLSQDRGGNWHAPAGVEWFVSTDGNDVSGTTIRVTKMTNYLSNSPNFTYTSLRERSGHPPRTRSTAGSRLLDNGSLGGRAANVEADDIRYFRTCLPMVALLQPMC